MAILQPKEIDNSTLRIIFRDHDADRRRSAVYALGQIGRKYPAQKSAVSKILSGVMNDRGENRAARWLAAASLLKMGQKVEAFFAETESSQTLG